jgi:hypothetical protein
VVSVYGQSTQVGQLQQRLCSVSTGSCLPSPACLAHLLALVGDLAHLAADEALDGEEGVLGVDDALALGDLGEGVGGEGERKVREGSGRLVGG